MPISISIRADIKKLQRSLDDLARKQLPFATATALTAIARRVQEAETAALPKVFDRPTPFTMRAFGVRAARKSNLTATVYARDIQAAYLAPYEFGGKQVIRSGRAWLTPENVPLNQYGGLPRNALKTLRGRSDIFIGAVKTKNGIINGVWQRPARAAQMVRKRGAKGRLAPNATGHLKLLVKFTDPVEVKQHLGYRSRAQQVIQACWRPEFEKAVARALATAK